MDELKTILDRIKKPLTFASRDGFAHLKSLAALEPFMRVQCGELRRIKQDQVELDEIEKLFFGFDTLSVDQKKDRILKAAALIKSLEQERNDPSTRIITAPHKSLPVPSSPEAHPNLRLDTPIQYCKGIGPNRSELLKKLGIFTVEEVVPGIHWAL